VGAAYAQANDFEARLNALEHENAALRKQVGELREMARARRTPLPPPAPVAAVEVPAPRPSPAAVVVAAPTPRPVLAAQASMPVKVPMAAGASPWSGPYVGLALGMQANDIVGNEDDALTARICGSPGGGGLSNGCIRDVPLGSTAFRVSPYVGYNYQFAPRWLAGLEADFGWAAAKNQILGMTGAGGIT